MRLAVGLVVFAAILAAAVTEGGTRSVTGVVKDSYGNELPTAVVEIENTRSFAVASFITRADGRYNFNQLSPDIDYTLRARYRNIWSKSKLLNKFNGSRRVVIDLEIPTK